MSRKTSLKFRTVAGCLAIIGMSMQPATAIETIEGFDDVSTLADRGWNFRNLSSPVGDLSWFQGDSVIFDAQAGPLDSYLAANLDSVDGLGTISNWAITPMLTYSNGDRFSFYTRTETNSVWPDRLEVRLSTHGNSSDVGTTATSVGDFTGLLLSINPALTSRGYPEVWTQYDITLSGLAAPTTGRIAFRYFVTNAGAEGNFGNYIGIDTLRITTAVPEPSTWVLGGVMVAAIGVLRARDKSRSRAESQRIEPGCRG